MTAQEELDKLAIAKQTIADLEAEIKSKSILCPDCAKWYYKGAFSVNSRTITRTVCSNPLTGGYLDPYEYEDAKYLQVYYECPLGHEVFDREWAL